MIFIMTAKKVFVTGAAGQTGREVVKELTTNAKNVEVWAGYRKDESGQKTFLQTIPNAHPCPCETNVESLTNCFRDVQDLFIIPPSTDDKVTVAKAYIDAAKKANVKFVLLLSVLGADKKDYSWGDQFHQIEEHLKSSGVESWCILRTPFYAQNLLLYHQQLQEGYLPLPVDSNNRFSQIDVCDVGKLVSAIFQDCSPHKGKVYEITGSEAMSADHLAQLMSKTLNRDIKWKQISNDEARKILQHEKVPEIEIKGLLDFYELAKTNCWSEVSGDFEKICGCKPTPLAEFINRHKTAMVSL